MNNIKTIIKNNKILYYPIKIFLDFFREFKYLFMKLFLFSMRVFKIKNNRILVVSYNGKGFGDNCKYVALELLKISNNMEIYWAVKNSYEEFPKGIKTVKFNSLMYYYLLVTSKIWLDNTRKPIYVIKRRGQVYFQFWHGCLPLKKIEFDADDKLSKVYLRGSKNDSKMTDYIVSNSKYCSEILYKRALKCDKKILEFGSPREDILFNKNITIIKKVKKQFNIDSNQKVILYAPTFRDNYSNQYNLDFEKLINNLEKETNNEWIVLMRLHPNVSSEVEKYNIQFNNKVFNASEYNDIQELIITSDLVITDYSSLMFDSLLANIPVILYASDYDEYLKERGFYFQFSELPFQLYKNNDELLNFSYFDLISKMQNNYLLFKNKMGFFEGGNSSLKIAEKIKEIIDEDVK